MSKKSKDKIGVELGEKEREVIALIDKEHKILGMEVHTVLSDGNGKLFVAFSLAEIIKSLK